MWRRDGESGMLVCAGIVPASRFMRRRLERRTPAGVGERRLALKRHLGQPSLDWSLLPRVELTRSPVRRTMNISPAGGTRIRNQSGRTLLRRWLLSALITMGMIG